jgi:hypothetical protein
MRSGTSGRTPPASDTSQVPCLTDIPLYFQSKHDWGKFPFGPVRKRRNVKHLLNCQVAKELSLSICAISTALREFTWCNVVLLLVPGA